jgi:hypothetical protein
LNDRPDTDGVRLGRKLAHGRRVQPITTVEEAQSVLSRFDATARSAARALLRRALASESITGAYVRPQEEAIATVLARCGVLRLEEKVEGTAAVYHWRPYRARIADGRRDEVRHALGKLDPDHARQTLLSAIAMTPELADEHELLAAIPHGSPLRPPDGSRTRTTVWSTYEAALRAATGWYNATMAGRRLSKRELAATTLGWSKAWTDARIAAFERLIGRNFAEAVETSEPEVRLRGPLHWSDGTTTIADAATARPWIAIPAQSAQTHGKLDHSQAQGVLVIENLDTFEAICRHSAVPDTWLCLWGHGYVNDSLVSLVAAMKKLTACWSDLDAHGIAIVKDLQRRTGVTVSPIFMDSELHANSAFLEQDDQQRRLAADLATTGHPRLRTLASRIAETGLGREQETMHDLIPTKLLATLTQQTLQDSLM